MTSVVQSEAKADELVSFLCTHASLHVPSGGRYVVLKPDYLYNRN